MELIKVGVKKIDGFKGELPIYQTKNASGLDVRAQLEDSIELSPGERCLVPTLLSVEIPTGFEIQVRPRSGWAAKKSITVLNTPGTIDSDYRGEIKVILINHGKELQKINDQDRIGQLVLAPVFQISWQESAELSETDRGSAGFGSTGLQD